ncbi:MAG TPA: hypothetical protein VKG79_07900 [Bryobacteraceae bacterium]|nr:hypothetical protein [Bryobacteraceae bacterium]
MPSSTKPSNTNRVRYKICSPLQAVKLEEHPGSSLRDPTGTLIQIPTDAILELEGGVAHSGLINVLWGGGAFSVFYEDLQERARPVTPADA